jgi:hypothetical protein
LGIQCTKQPRTNTQSLIISHDQFFLSKRMPMLNSISRIGLLDVSQRLVDDAADAAGLVRGDVKVLLSVVAAHVREVDSVGEVSAAWGGGGSGDAWGKVRLREFPSKTCQSPGYSLAASLAAARVPSRVGRLLVFGGRPCGRTCPWPQSRGRGVLACEGCGLRRMRAGL